MSGRIALSAAAPEEIRTPDPQIRSLVLTRRWRVAGCPRSRGAAPQICRARGPLCGTLWMNLRRSEWSALSARRVVRSRGHEETSEGSKVSQTKYRPRDHNLK